MLVAISLPAQQPPQPSPPPDTVDGVNAMNGDYIKVWRSIMAPKNVADSFGRRIATKYIAMQVTIANLNKDYQWLIQDASMDISRLIGLENDPARKCQPNLKLLLSAVGRERLRRGIAAFDDATRVTSAELTVLRGVAEKGQSLDPRNVTLRALTAAGVIAAGLAGVTDFGRSFAPGVAAFNGPLLSAFQVLFPDYTVNQLNRLNDSAFLANTVVGKQQAKVIVLFIPQSDLLTSAQQKQYYKDPESIYGCPDLRLLEPNVDGNFIANITGAPMVTAVTIDSSEAAKFQTDKFAVNGSIIGNFLAGTTIDLVSPPKGLTIKPNGDPTDKGLKFILSDDTPLMPGTTLDFVIRAKTGDPVHVGYKVEYSASAPAVISMDMKAVKAGESVKIMLKGARFQPQGMKVLLDPSADLTVGAIQFNSTTEIVFDVAASAGAATANRSLKVSTTGGVSDTALTLSVTK